ncbi:helix-hairpin-helix domain-containing protein [Ktedonospora formicarum]|uniref:DNA-binding protein n=1 Tax=Ktedonospora formicarum TaxID=2778364 RepID=A0A8J3I7F3_9CHLR|nr:helix-hairpin-helix domain-containing protein [Ktedonospora formicarum]GHO48240.1 hypothetical protein KSX_64030 [Ktedonospora formicarum]
MKYDSLTPLTDVGLAAPAVRALHGAGYHTLGDVANASDAKLASLHGFGPNGLKRLRLALADVGLRDQGDAKPTEPNPSSTERK